MKNPSGKVLSLVDSIDGVRAIVVVEVAAACPRCATGKGCGAGIFAVGGSDRQVEASVRSGLDIAVDDVVEIVYGLPMLGAIAGAAIAYVLVLGDAAAAMAALLGLGAGLAIGRWRLRQTNCLRRFTPSVERLC